MRSYYSLRSRFSWVALMASLLTALSASDMVTAPVVIAFLGLILSALALRRLTATAPKSSAAATRDVDAQITLLDLLLPQTQCGQCGHLGRQRLQRQIGFCVE